jgi:hypothetical protein
MTTISQTIPSLGSPPLTSDPANFDTRADTLYGTSLPAFIAATNTWAAQANTLTIAGTLSETQDTSATSNSIGTGSKTFTVTAGKSWVVGMWLLVADTADPATNYMVGAVTSYSSTALTINVSTTAGSGTKTAWTISQTSAGGATLAANTFTGLQTFAAGADIASAATIDLTAATGNTVVITGTTPTTALTMTAGQQMLLLPSGAWPMTFNATTMNINGGVSYTCSAGDRVFAAKDLAGVIRVSVIKQNGTPLVAPASGLTLITTITPTVANTAQALTAFTSTYDNYRIVGVGLIPGVADDVLRVRLANAGVVDSGNNYSLATAAINSTHNLTQVNGNIGSNSTLYTGLGMNFVIDVLNVNQGTGQIKSIIGRTEHQISGSNVESITVDCSYKGAAATGIQFYWATRNFQAQGKIFIYGYANS